MKHYHSTSITVYNASTSAQAQMYLLIYCVVFNRLSMSVVEGHLPSRCVFILEF